MPPKKKPSGAANMAAAGRKALVVSLTPAEREIIRVAAAKNGRASSVWLRELGLEAAKHAGK